MLKTFPILAVVEQVGQHCLRMGLRLEQGSRWETLRRAQARVTPRGSWTKVLPTCTGSPEPKTHCPEPTAYCLMTEVKNLFPSNRRS